LDTNLDWLLVVLVVLGACVVIALAGLLLMVRSIRRLNIPPDADYFTTLRYVPLALVILLDLLDAGLDILAAPIAWVILDRMGLRGLRNKAAVEALIPFTQVIPTFTLSWIAARTLQLGDPPWERYDRALERRLPR
jgi:hypothetical protein